MSRDREIVKLYHEIADLKTRIARVTSDEFAQEIYETAVSGFKRVCESTCNEVCLEVVKKMVDKSSRDLLIENARLRSWAADLARAAVPDGIEGDDA